jgi:hypothetical protein
MLLCAEGYRRSTGCTCIVAGGKNSRKIPRVSHIIHPENRCASLIEPRSDPAAYAKARKLWLAVARRNDAPSEALVAAAAFFEGADPELAAKIVNRASFPAARRKADARLANELRTGEILTLDRDFEIYQCGANKRFQAPHSLRLTHGAAPAGMARIPF